MLRLQQRDPGVSLLIEVGTCGRLIAPESSRCIRCHNRRMWLLQYGLNQAEVVVTVLLEAAAAKDDVRRDVGPAVQMPDAVPLLDDLSGFDPCLRCRRQPLACGRLDSFPPSRADGTLS